MAQIFPAEDVGNSDDSEHFNDWSSLFKKLPLMVFVNAFGSI